MRPWRTRTPDDQPAHVCRAQAAKQRGVKLGNPALAVKNAADAAVARRGAAASARGNGRPVGQRNRDRTQRAQDRNAAWRRLARRDRDPHAKRLGLA